MKIKNYNDLAVTDLRKAALQIAEAGLSAVDTKLAVKDAVRFEDGVLKIMDTEVDFDKIGKIFVVGVGKCSLEAGAALEEILEEKIAGGVVIDIHPGKLKKIRTFAGTHPLPTKKNMDATKAIIQVLKDAKENDLVIAVISGGGSTLLCQPQDLTCEEESAIVQCLTRAGADIYKVNTVRKHLSLARGGYLAEYAYPAYVVSLIFSDVPGDNLEFVASGPTVMDTTTVGDAEKILAEYGVRSAVGLKTNGLVETPKDAKYFEKVKNLLVVSNKTALEAMREEANNLGFRADIVNSAFSGEASELGEDVIMDLGGYEKKTVLLYGGESTVRVVGKGTGGRNQELALSALRLINDEQLVLALASDGRDNTAHAGAICDKITKGKALKLGLDASKFLENNDSYEFFKKTGDFIETGDTGSNVSDLIIAINE